jgi:RNA polymerase sigma factor (sigma-70 family)
VLKRLPKPSLSPKRPGSRDRLFNGVKISLMQSDDSAAAGNDSLSFEMFWDAEFAGVFRFAYLLVEDRELGADLTQEAFARALSRWGEVGKLVRPDAWIRTVVHNLAVSALRRRGVFSRLHIPRSDTQLLPTEPEDRELMSALGQLSPNQRLVLVLRFYEDLSVEQVALVTGKRPGTVRALTSQGLARMRRLLPEEVPDE